MASPQLHVASCSANHPRCARIGTTPQCAQKEAMTSNSLLTPALRGQRARYRRSPLSCDPAKEPSR
jgi:hypothetical protein